MVAVKYRVNNEDANTKEKTELRGKHSGDSLSLNNRDTHTAVMMRASRLHQI